MLAPAHQLENKGVLMRPRFNMKDVLAEAIKARYYFDIKFICNDMIEDGLVKEDGSFYAFALRERAKGRDCYDTVCFILQEGEAHE